MLQFDDSGRPVLVGVVHAGVRCSELDFPGMYMRASSYVAWMRAVGATFEVAPKAQQVLDSSSPLPFEPTFSVVSVPSPVPSPTVCPVVLPQQNANKPVAGIVGGSPASNVSMQILAAFHDFFGFQCAGTVIASKWVLATASCVRKANHTVFIGGRNARSGFRTAIEDIFLPSEKGNDLNVDTGNVYDYAVVLLKKRVPSSTFAWMNNNDSLPFPSAFAKAVRYGNMAEDVPNSDAQLRQVNIPVMSSERCKQIFSWFNDDMLCDGCREGRCDSCQGDGGGPLLQYDDMGTAVMIGIIWRGVGCARPFSHGVYIRISSILNWLKGNGATVDK